MRVMMLTPVYIPWVGGLEILVRQVSQELVRRGHELMVVSGTGGEAPPGLGEVDGTPVLRVLTHDAMRKRDLAAIFDAQRDIARVTRDFAPDVVHSHDAGPVLWLHLRVARNRPRPLLVTLHNVMSHHLPGALEMLTTLLRRADRVTGVSQDVVDDTLRYAPDIADRLSVVRNGIEPPTATATPVPHEPPRLACIGRLVPQKGFDRALDAMATLRARHPDLRLVVAGHGPDRAALEAHAATLGIGDHVDFLGSVGRDEIAALLESSTAVVMPSRFEGLPLVALEAAWAGRPVVATRVPGLEEAVVDGETALVVDADGRDLAHAIDALLGDPALADRLGVGARAFAEREYSLAACVDAYEVLYRELARTGAAG